MSAAGALVGATCGGVQAAIYGGRAARRSTPDPGLRGGAPVLRPMAPADVPGCVAISEPLPDRAPRLELEFFVYPTLVAEVDGVIAGYTQFTLTPDGTLHSLALRIGTAWKGQGLGGQLMARKVELAKAAGATTHIYAVAKDGEVALKKILERLGMHACQARGGVVIYMQWLGE